VLQDQSLFELRRRTFDTPHFRGIEFIEAEAKTIINKVPGNYLPFKWTINPYRGCSHACHFCYARATHTYLDMNAGSDFETKIVVKVNAPALLKRELTAKKWKGEHIAMGTNVDPYQRAEGRYKLMPEIIATLTEFRNPFSILTRGPLILRDLELLVAAAEVTDVATAMSIPTLDEDAWHKTEPGAPNPRKRMEAVAKLNAAGIPCGVMVAPILPGITDDPKKLMDVVRAAVDAGATHISPILLHLRPVVREEYMAWLKDAYPHLVQSYEEMYAQGAYGPKEERKAVGRRVAGLVRAAGGLRPTAKVSERWARQKPSGPPVERPRQLQLL
jgi:DNA repair photolyase